MRAAAFPKISSHRLISPPPGRSIVQTFPKPGGVANLLHDFALSIVRPIVMDTSVARAAQPSASSSSTQPSNAPDIAVFRNPAYAPQGWSLSPTRMLEAAELSIAWKALGWPQPLSRARAVRQIRRNEKESPHGPFLRSLEVTSAKMPVQLLHEILLVQNLIFHWSEDDDALARCAWPTAQSNLPDEIFNRDEVHYYKSSLSESPPWSFGPVRFDDTARPIDFNYLTASMGKVRVLMQYLYHLHEYLNNRGKPNSNVREARYAFEYVYRYRKGLSIPESLARIVAEELGHWDFNFQEPNKHKDGLGGIDEGHMLTDDQASARPSAQLALAVQRSIQTSSERLIEAHRREQTPEQQGNVARQRKSRFDIVEKPGGPPRQAQEQLISKSCASTATAAPKTAPVPRKVVSFAPELLGPAVKAPPLAGPSLKISLKRRRAELEPTSHEEEPMSSGRGQKSKDPEPSAVPSYGFAPILTANESPEPPAVPIYGITPRTNNNSEPTAFPTHSVVNPRASKKPRLLLADEGPRDDSTFSDAPSSGLSKGDERRRPEAVLMLSDSDSEEIPGRTGAAEPSVCSDSEDPPDLTA
ncbi:hypothetical protein A4X06_0g1057 [Tilletia controversa]|uniref:Uncharacterized protein n=1 Tax=Tilletia controversa TaxID=13291 RepID=A0A8X7SZL7_9BASI|nr:hypothetical protein CF328_g818 [Tilletia controversa]KAE8254103.1 hypothetical protein A4X06_0g1057 [Tilletia controversa]